MLHFTVAFAASDGRLVSDFRIVRFDHVHLISLVPKAGFTKAMVAVALHALRLGVKSTGFVSDAAQGFSSKASKHAKK